MTFTEAALEVLKGAGEPLHYKKITELAIAGNLLSHVGKTPEVTMSSRLATLVKKDRGQSPIIKVRPGVFALRESGMQTDKESSTETLQPTTPPQQQSQRPKARHAECRTPEACRARTCSPKKPTTTRRSWPASKSESAAKSAAVAGAGAGVGAAVRAAERWPAAEPCARTRPHAGSEPRRNVKRAGAATARVATTTAAIAIAMLVGATTIATRSDSTATRSRPEFDRDPASASASDRDRARRNRPTST